MSQPIRKKEIRRQRKRRQKRQKQRKQERIGGGVARPTSPSGFSS